MYSPYKHTKKFDLLYEGESHQKYSSAGPGYSYQLTESPPEVSKEHHSKLRSGDIESMVVQIEVVAIHHPAFEMGEPFF